MLDAHRVRELPPSSPLGRGGSCMSLHYCIQPYYLGNCSWPPVAACARIIAMSQFQRNAAGIGVFTLEPFRGAGVGAATIEQLIQECSRRECGMLVQ
jgi:hypothetical protein